MALGSNSVTLVICLRKSDSCIPGWEPRLLNCARGLARITWRFTAKPGGERRGRKVKVKEGAEVSQHELKAHYESITITAENE